MITMITRYCINCGECFGLPCPVVANLAHTICNEATGALRTITYCDREIIDSTQMDNNPDQIALAILNSKNHIQNAGIIRVAKTDITYDTKDGDKTVTVLYILKAKYPTIFPQEE